MGRKSLATSWPRNNQRSVLAILVNLQCMLPPINPANDTCFRSHGLVIAASFPPVPSRGGTDLYSAAPLCITRRSAKFQLAQLNIFAGTLDTSIRSATHPASTRYPYHFSPSAEMKARTPASLFGATHRHLAIWYASVHTERNIRRSHELEDVQRKAESRVLLC